MRTDLFNNSKCIHFKINKELHFALRSKLFKYNLSMQELFEEFTRLVATDTQKGQSIVDMAVNRKIKNFLRGDTKTLTKRKINNINIGNLNDDSVGNLDSEILYKLINGVEDDK